jgi:hypothetical protein
MPPKVIRDDLNTADDAAVENIKFVNMKGIGDDSNPDRFEYHQIRDHFAAKDPFRQHSCNIISGHRREIPLA